MLSLTEIKENLSHFKVFRFTYEVFTFMRYLRDSDYKYKITEHDLFTLVEDETNPEQFIHDAEIKVYLMSDSVTGGVPGQKEKTGQYNIGEMLTNIINHGVSSLIPGATLGTLADLTKWIVEADKSLIF